MKTPEQIAEAIHESMPLSTTRVALMVAAINEDRAQRAETPAYKVGDPDPTPDFQEVDEEYCEAAIPEGQSLWACTWESDHPGRPHVAGDGEIIRAVWS